MVLGGFLQLGTLGLNGRGRHPFVVSPLLVSERVARLGKSSLGWTGRLKRDEMLARVDWSHQDMFP